MQGTREQLRTQEGFDKSRETGIPKKDLAIFNLVGYEFAINGLGNYTPMVPHDQSIDGRPMRENWVRIIVGDGEDRGLFIRTAKSVINLRDGLSHAIKDETVLAEALNGAARVTAQALGYLQKGKNKNH